MSNEDTPGQAEARRRFGITVNVGRGAAAEFAQQWDKNGGETAGQAAARLRGFTTLGAVKFARRWDEHGGETAGQAEARRRGFIPKDSYGTQLALWFAADWDRKYGPGLEGETSEEAAVHHDEAAASAPAGVFAARAQQIAESTYAHRNAQVVGLDEEKSGIAARSAIIHSPALDADAVFARRRAESAPPRKEEAELRATFAKVASSQLEVTAALPLDAEAIFSRRRTEVETTHATVQERSGS